MKRNNNLIVQSFYDVNEEPIVLSKPLMDLFLSRDRPGDLIALYLFYYYTAKWQRTNQVRATDAYCQKGLKWGKDKFRNAKKELLELGLIKQIRGRDEEQGFITAWYIQVMFIWRKETVDNLSQHKKAENGSVVGESLEGGFPTSSDRPINALSTNNNINALSNNTAQHEKNKQYRPLARKLATIIQSKKNITHTVSQIKSWIKPIQKLIEINQVSFDRVKDALDWYAEHINEPYVPVIGSGTSLRDKFGKLEDAIEREKNPIKNKSVNTIGYKEEGKTYRKPDRIIH